MGCGMKKKTNTKNVYVVIHQPESEERSENRAVFADRKSAEKYIEKTCLFLADENSCGGRLSDEWAEIHEGWQMEFFIEEHKVFGGGK